MFGGISPKSPSFPSALQNHFKINRIIYSTAGTFSYTQSTGLIGADIEVQAGGGGGGGAATSGATQAAAGGGGGGGGYARSFLTAAQIGLSAITITVAATAAGGVAGNNNGTAGNSSSFGSLVVAAGGGPGGGSSASGAGAFNFGGAGTGGTVSAGNLQIPGSSGFIGLSIGPQTFGISGHGGNSHYGAGAGPVVSSIGLNGSNYGGGGSGGATGNTSQVAGGIGAQGLVIVTEYIGL